MRYMAIAFVADEAKTIPDKRDDSHGQITYSDLCSRPTAINLLFGMVYSIQFRGYMMTRLWSFFVFLFFFPEIL